MFTNYKNCDTIDNRERRKRQPSIFIEISNLNNLINHSNLNLSRTGVTNMRKKDFETVANSIKFYVDNAYELRANNDKQVDLGNSVDRTKEYQQFETLEQ